MLAPASPARSDSTAAPSGGRPSVELDISLPAVYRGELATLRWKATGAKWCRALLDWKGDKPVSGEEQVGPLDEPGKFGLECGNDAGTGTASVTYSIEQRTASHEVGVFDLGCNFSHSLNDDPIVFPRQPGKSHRHDFFGFTRTDAMSTPETMRADLQERPGNTTCTEEGRIKGGPPAANASAYWVPAAYLNGEKVDAHHVHVYYRSEARKVVSSFPSGFRMIAGDAHSSAEEAKAAGRIHWRCGGLNNPRVDRIPADCEGEKTIHAEIRLPSCWNGQVDSPNHKDHLSYGENGGCPASHPRRLPRILMHVAFNVYAETNKRIRANDELTLASGGMWTMHADYLFAWDPFRLDQLVHECLNAKEDCRRKPPGDSAAGDEGDTAAEGSEETRATAGSGPAAEGHARTKSEAAGHGRKHKGRRARGAEGKRDHRGQKQRETAAPAHSQHAHG